MSKIPLRVVKLGGSLLELDGLPDRLNNWFSKQDESRSVIVVGGGPAVEDIRQKQNRTQTEEEVHWNCIDLMAENARRLSQSLYFPVWREIREIESLKVNQIVFFSVAQWLRENRKLLPCTWDVSSDSIAAALATELWAEELVLLKSCLPDDIDNSHADNSYVDAHFPISAKKYLQNVPHGLVRFVNLRAEGFPETKL